MFIDENIIEQILEKKAVVDLSQVPGDSFIKKLDYLFQKSELQKLDAESLYELFKKMVDDPKSTLSRKKQLQYLDTAEKYAEDKKRLLKFIYDIYLSGIGQGVIANLADEILKIAEKEV